MTCSDDKVYHFIKLLLYIAKLDNVEVTATKLQKIFFLLEKEKGINVYLTLLASQTQHRSVLATPVI